MTEKGKVKAKATKKVPFTTKVPAKERQKALHLTRSQIGVHGASTAIKESLYA